MDKKTEKNANDTLMEAARFIQQHKPPAPRDKVGDFIGFTKRRLNALAEWFLIDKGVIDKNGVPRVVRRNLPRPDNMQVR